MTLRILFAGIAAGIVSLTAVAADAQPIGTFRWQLQPFCNVVTVNVTQQGAVYTMDGYDDQCGATRRAPIVGLGTPNPDGTIGLGWNIVTTPGGRGVQVDARITLPSASGSWSDSAGNAGTLALGASTGGSARPLPSSAAAIPGAFSLLTDGSFLARGATSAGPIPASGPGTRMMWYSAKGAFRAGYVDGEQWNDSNVGILSTAMGVDTIASGIYGTAFGVDTIASAAFSSAMGRNTRATGTGSTAIGDTTTASGEYSTAMGNSTTAGGSSSTAMGSLTTASGVTSTAMGARRLPAASTARPWASVTTASGVRSTAMGNETIASGSSSTAMGFGSVASGGSSVAAGFGAIAAGSASVALGRAHARFDGSFVWGDGSTTARQLDAEPNQFIVRATRGVGFYTNAANTLGVELPIGGGGWTVLSDCNAKEAFRALDLDDVLARIAALPMQEWQLPGPARRRYATSARWRRTSTKRSASARALCASTSSTPTASRSPASRLSKRARATSHATTRR